MATLLGRHLLIELYGCNRARLDDEEFLRSHAVAAAQAMGACVVGVHSHRFQPVGVSVVVVLAESHLALHTWPERGVASADIFVCSAATDPHRGKTYLTECLEAAGVAELELHRGHIDHECPHRWREIELTANS